MLVLCPNCQRQLNIPDDAGGKQVRCPLCQCVFMVAAPTAVYSSAAPPPALPPAAPPPPAASPSSLPAALPAALPAERERGRWDDEPRDDRRRPDRRDDDDDAPPLRARPGQTGVRGWAWLLTAGVYSGVAILLNFLLNLVAISQAGGPFRGPGADGYVIGMFCGIIFLSAPVVFIIVGAVHLRKTGVRGLVITGVVFAFIVAGLFLLGALVNFVTLMSPNQFGGPTVHAITLVQTVFVLAGAGLNLTGAIMALSVLGRPEVRAAFDRHTNHGRDRDRWERETGWERRRRSRDDD